MAKTNHDSANRHLVRAVLLLRRRAHDENVPREVARQLASLATAVQCLVESVEPLERKVQATLAAARESK